MEILNTTQIDAHSLCEYAARTCYRSLDKYGTNPTFLTKKVLQPGHTSVLEHWRVVFTMNIGCISEAVKLASMPGVYARALAPNESYDNMIFSMNLRHIYELGYTVLDNMVAPFMPMVFHHGPGKVDVELTPIKNPHKHVNLIAHCPGPLGSYTFEVYCSRACSHQLVRHRTFSFSQESQRYVDAYDIEFQMPVLDSSDMYEEYNYVFGLTLDMYCHLRNSGETKQDARYVLPSGAMTRLIVTIPTPELDNFFDLRCSSKAQDEVRGVAEEIRRQIDGCLGR